MLVAWVISSHCLRALCDEDTSLSPPGRRRARSLRCTSVCVNPAPAAGEDVKMQKNAIFETIAPSVSWTSCTLITRGSLILLSAFNKILGHQEDDELFRKLGKERN